MKINKWTVGLAAAGVVSLASVAQADEAKENVMSAVSGTTISGYVSTSAIWKFGTGDTLVGRAYDGTAKQDGFNLDVVNLTIAKPLGDDEWSAGYTAELLFGPDANTLGTSSTGVNNDFGIKQAYVALRAPVGNGLTFKIGVWDTLIGYEVFNAGDNPNYSRSYGFTIEPTTHTGIQATYKLADWISVTAAAADDAVGTATINARGSGIESRKDYLGSINITAPDSWGFLKGSTISAGAIKAASGTFGSDVVNYYAGGAFNTPVDGLTVGASYDYRGNSVDKVHLVASAHASSVALYTSYKASEKLKLNLRAEYATGSDGTWYFSDPLGVNPNHRNELLGVTGTVDYSLWANVISRVELRWDRALTGGSQIPVAGTGNHPFGLNDGNAVSLALNVIYKF